MKRFFLKVVRRDKSCNGSLNYDAKYFPKPFYKMRTLIWVWTLVETDCRQRFGEYCGRRAWAGAELDNLRWTWCSRHLSSDEWPRCYHPNAGDISSPPTGAYCWSHPHFLKSMPNSSPITPLLFRCPYLSLSFLSELYATSILCQKSVTQYTDSRLCSVELLYVYM